MGFPKVYCRLRYNQYKTKDVHDILMGRSGQGPLLPILQSHIYFLGFIKKTKTFFMNDKRLFLPMFVPIVRYIKVKNGIRVYDSSKQTRAYWKKRAFRNALNSIYSRRVENLFKRQCGLCPICQDEITGEQICLNQLHLHHRNPQSKSDNHRLTNLRLLHDVCHGELHRILSLEEMSKLAVGGILT